LIRRHNTARGTPSIFNAVVQCSSRPLVEVAPVSFVEFERGFVTQPRAATKLPRQGAQVRAHGHRRLALRVMAILCAQGSRRDMRQLSLSLVLASSLALAQQQERPSDPPLVIAPTRTDSAPTAHAAILADNRVALLTRGLEMGAGLRAGFSSPPSLRVGIGYAWPSLSLMFTPAVLSSFSLANSSQQQVALALEASARLYLWSRSTGTITPYLAPALSVSFSPGSNGGSISPGIGISGGAEYLITPRFGVTLDLGMNLFVSGIESPAGGLLSVFGLQGGLAVVLHR
jgi:hypothetical protein